MLAAGAARASPGRLGQGQVAGGGRLPLEAKQCRSRWPAGPTWHRRWLVFKARFRFEVLGQIESEALAAEQAPLYGLAVIT